MNNNPKVNGFPVIVLAGREITEAEVSKLDDVQKAKVVRRINGPHHTSKWANGGHGPVGRKRVVVPTTRTGGVK